MDGTKLSLRQKKILSIITKEALSRPQINLFLEKIYPISKLTLIRELNYLMALKIVKKIGSGNNIRYALKEENPLLNFIDIQQYFDDQASRNKLNPIAFNFKMFDYLKNLITPQDLNEFEIILLSLREQEKKLDPTIFRREIERFIIEFSWKSSKIEGNTYSLLETEVLIKQSKEAPGHSKYEAVMILNHKRAIEYILLHRNIFKKITLSQIINLHAILTKGLEVTSGIRNNPVAISGSNYLPLSSKKEIENSLNKFIKAVNSNRNPLEKALISLTLISYIQPFADGNKRTARVLANAVLISHDCYPVTFRNVEDTDYLKALLLFYEKTNLFNFKHMFLEQYRFALQNYFRT
ncbi:MAG: Fic family protein [Candidatus Roizmanbacteria bacterium GW2011_GWA2_35_19]|uniref:Fic family protein n=2 Tax=Candidatus Roizmaniibacteriota TaxID=1752723 RepID=A0A0G0BVJ5_9BACT|nr:MAG: Fic family protein [Candidatus Roizmanbacteria bacterium GW2011_GWC2_35_12]KKP73308.1 MAG: Fic family protein [Candidatus Roizmanbacteria bacterium GW2011_GWA2_35_19]